jgi:L-ascorbate metabolism protein UlaG (beta-lactamase superfamily)
MRARAVVIFVASLIVCGGSRRPTLAQSSGSGLVKITPLGSHAGELCRNDRALLFEDPAGVRVLYDPGRTVDETDPRLGDVHVILLSHAHTDHIGDVRPNRSSPGTCAAPTAGAANPNTNLAAIAALKNSAVFSPGELDAFLARKILNVRGAAPGACPALGLENETDVPMGGPCTASLRPGGSRTVVRIGSPGSVRIAAVPAFHSSGIDPGLIDAPGEAPGLRASGGSEAGFVISFTNGLVVYLTGDSGMFGDMETIIGRFYHPNLIVINMSDTVTFGPLEAAWVIKYLLRPATVMPSHVNEAATSGGAVAAGTRVDRFMIVARGIADVVLPLSDVTRSFDGSGRCVACK